MLRRKNSVEVFRVVAPRKPQSYFRHKSLEGAKGDLSRSLMLPATSGMPAESLCSAYSRLQRTSRHLS